MIGTSSAATLDWRTVAPPRPDSPATGARLDKAIAREADMESSQYRHHAPTDGWCWKRYFDGQVTRAAGR